VDSLPLRRLVTGTLPASDRIFFSSIWFKGHNNPRYAELLPRLGRLDRYLVVCSEERVVRGVQYRAYKWSRSIRNPTVMGLAGRRYRSLFTADNEQIADFSGTVVSDVDDPVFTEREVELLSRPNLAAYVVTAERAGRRFEALGVQKQYHVIPQGVSLSSVTPELIASASTKKPRSTVVVGYMAAFMLTAADRDGEKALYNVDHLLDLWEEVHLRVPEARLWLVGGVSDRVCERIGGREDIVAFGERDEGIQAAKIAEYMGLGVPTVSYDYEVTAELRETGAGVLAGDARAFVDAVVYLVNDTAARRSVAAAARTAGLERNWDVLAARYENEILDRYLA
jgi:glycosyltransferase involved in cell wall biosynthesis